MNITELIASIKDGSQLSAAQKSSLQELIDFKTKLSLELDEEVKRINVLRISIQDSTDRFRVADAEKRVLELEIIDLKEQDTLKKSEIEKETKSKELCDKELKTLRTAVATKQEESKGKLEVVLRTTDDIALLHLNIKSQIQLIEQFQKEQQITLLKTQRLQDESKDQVHLSEHLYAENVQLETESNVKVLAYNHQRVEVKRITKLKDEILKKVLVLENQKNHFEQQKAEIKSENDSYTETIQRKKVAVDDLKKRLNDTSREGSLLTNMLQKSVVNTFRVVNMVELLTQVHSNLEFDLQRHKKSVKLLTDKSEGLRKNKEETVAESIRLQTLVVTSIRDLKEREIQIYDYRKKMLGVERKLTHQQALYEAVLNDRNIHSKHLLESQTEVTQMKRKLKTIHYQISNYKEEIRSKVAASQLETLESKKLTNEIESITKEIEKLKHQNELSTIYIRKQTVEENTLIQFLKSAETERSTQEHGLKILFGERDNLNLQLVQQNLKLAQVYEELRVGRSNERHFDLVFLKTSDTLTQSQTNTLSLREKRLELKTYTSELNALKHLSTQLENELLLEEIKQKALYRESLIPVNIHPWRTIENSNTKLFDLIKLFNQLQKQLILKNEKEKGWELLIQQQEKLYLQLKSIYGKQVGPEAVEQIREFQGVLGEKEDLLKGLGIELKVGVAKTREVEYEIEKCDGMLGDVKRKYISLKLKQEGV